MAVTITRTAWVDDDGTGTTGTVLNNVVKTELYNQIDGALAGVVPGTGVWVDVAFSAGNFTANGSMTWGVTAPQQTTYAYMVDGKKLTLLFYLGPTTTGGTANTQLRLALPAGLVSRNSTQSVYRYFDGTLSALGYAECLATATYLTLNRTDGSNWPLSASVFIQGSIVLAIQ